MKPTFLFLVAVILLAAPAFSDPTAAPAAPAAPTAPAPTTLKDASFTPPSGWLPMPQTDATRFCVTDGSTGRVCDVRLVTMAPVVGMTPVFADSSKSKLEAKGFTVTQCSPASLNNHDALQITAYTTIAATGKKVTMSGYMVANGADLYIVTTYSATTDATTDPALSDFLKSFSVK